MSRIGRKPIVIPAGVTVTVDEAAHSVTVKGPKGSLNSNYHPLMTVKVEGNEVLVTRPNDEPEARSLHGLTRSNIANMVNGVVNGYEKKLEIVGVGLRCQKQGSNLVMNLGFSHQVNIPDTEDCTIVWQDPNHFTVTGIDKQKVGQYAAEIRAQKPPEPYKGKGIRYEGEVVKHKEGKAGKGKYYGKECKTMVKQIDKNEARLRRHRRVRNKISGTAARPRLDVFRSAKHIYAQIIDDEQGVTLVSASTMDKDFNGFGGNVEAAAEIGKKIAAKALEKGITEVVFDRGGYVYHGRVKALADGAREGGLKL